MGVVVLAGGRRRSCWHRPAAGAAPAPMRLPVARARSGGWSWVVVMSSTFRRSGRPLSRPWGQEPAPPRASSPRRRTSCRRARPGDAADEEQQRGMEKSGGRPGAGERRVGRSPSAPAASVAGGRHADAGRGCCRRSGRRRRRRRRRLPPPAPVGRRRSASWSGSTAVGDVDRPATVSTELSASPSVTTIRGERSAAACSRLLSWPASSGTCSRRGRRAGSASSCERSVAVSNSMTRPGDARWWPRRRRSRARLGQRDRHAELLERLGRVVGQARDRRRLAGGLEPVGAEAELLAGDRDAAERASPSVTPFAPSLVVGPAS